MCIWLQRVKCTYVHWADVFNKDLDVLKQNQKNMCLF